LLIINAEDKFFYFVRSEGIETLTNSEKYIIRFFHAVDEKAQEKDEINSAKWILYMIDFMLY
jgi:hypothetical protein